MNETENSNCSATDRDRHEINRDKLHVESIHEAVCRATYPNCHYWQDLQWRQEAQLSEISFAVQLKWKPCNRITTS